MFSAMQTLSFHGSYFPILMAFFCFVYITGYFIVFRNWSPKQRPAASSCLISFCHGSPAVFLAAYGIFSNPVRGFSAPNIESQNLVLDFSIAYFTVDFLHLVFNSGDPLFIAHHVATLFVFVTCRYVAYHGAFALLVLLVLAEVTSFCQNIWTLAGLRKADLKFAEDVYKFVSYPFYGLYTIMRGFVGPWFFYKMSSFYLSGKADGVIPRWVAVSWIIVVGGAISVSILWIFHRWSELCSQMKKMDKKEQ